MKSNRFPPLSLTRRTAMLSTAIAGLFGTTKAALAARQKFVTANNNPYDLLDPHQLFDIGRIAVRLNMYDALTRWVDNPPKLEPWLIADQSISPDGKIYTFKLKSNVKFHDGTVMTSADVVYSMERILALKKGAYGLFKDVIEPGTTKALDTQTVQFKLKTPFAVFMAVLSELWVVNSTVVRKNEKNDDWGSEWLSKNEAGSGGYALRRYDPAIGFQAQRFEAHFAGWGKNPIDDAEFRVVLETATRVLGVIKGEFNTTDGYLPSEQMARMKENPNIKTWEAESIRTFYFIINHWKTPLNDVNLRKALSYAFDYDGFNDKILGGTVVRNNGIIPNPMWGAPKDLKGYTYDLDKAKYHLSLVKEKIRPLQIGAMAGYPQSEQAAQMLQAGCAKIGLDVRIVSEPYTTIAPKLSERERAHDLIPLWRSAYFADPHNWTGFLFNSGNFDAGNASYYKNPRVDELCNKALEVTDQEQRRSMYEDVSRILIEDAAGIFINNTKFHGAFTKNTKNIRFCPIGDAQDVRWIEMEA